MQTNFTIKKSASVDSKVEQVNKVDSNLIKPNANNVILDIDRFLLLPKRPQILKPSHRSPIKNRVAQK